MHFHFHCRASFDLLLVLLVLQVWRWHQGTCAGAACEKVSATSTAPPESFTAAATSAPQEVAAAATTTTQVSFPCTIAVANQSITASCTHQQFAEAAHQWIKAVQLPLGTEWGAMVSQDCA